MKSVLSCGILSVLSCLVWGADMELSPFGRVRVLDVVDCTKEDARFSEVPAGKSSVEKVLGEPCRVMPVQADESSYMAWRLGKGKGLRANGSYVVVVEYPDDLPRTYFVVNRSTDSHRSFYTGASLGDAWAPKYVDNRSESLALPQSGRYERWMSYGSLMDRTREAEETTVLRTDANGNPVLNQKGEEQRDPVFLSPEDGFDFVLAQPGRDHDPISHGIAVRRILLCEIPQEQHVWAKLTLPPAPLPQRHLFWREEMSDSGPLQGDTPQCANRVDWFEHKARQMKMMGMNTYMKDLLEFGHVQHWNPDVIRPNWAWKDAKTDGLWEKAVDIMSRYGFSILPYYEWYGNRGADYEGKPSFGNQKRAKTLGGKDSYTHIWWTEGANLDVTDPESFVETKRLLEATILRFKDRASFVGALFRTRPSQWPISFADATLERFSKDEMGGKRVSRDDLKQDAALYKRYVAWWHRRRAAFLKNIQTFLREQGLPNADVLLSSETSEAGSGIQGGGLVVDDKEAWTKRFTALGWKVPSMKTTAETVREHSYLKARREPGMTWGDWEWQHACPADDPENYASLHPHVWLALPVNRLFSVADPEVFAAYRNSSGMQTVIRHYSLNEDMLYRKGSDGKETRLCGYCMADMEHAGRACMMNEVVSMANGDPANFGYFMGSSFARGFPGPVREFNQNFLALPALPSRLLPGACSDPEVVLKEIDCRKWKCGRYFFLVHTGATEKTDVVVQFPKGVSHVTAIVSGKAAPLDADGKLTVKRLAPWLLLSLHSK